MTKRFKQGDKIRNPHGTYTVTKVYSNILICDYVSDDGKNNMSGMQMKSRYLQTVQELTERWK
ncbi:MAG: hypothetical protein LBC84_00790 [Prevotellaceae bacterium]|jgi:hypothetical protein|nr:hypothetical protein [Prevotellaceae bacterium]